MEFRKLGEIAQILQKTINPQKYKEKKFVLYSLPGFDNHKLPESVSGKEINSNKIIIKQGCILFNKLNLRFKRIWNIQDDLDNMICSTEFIPLIPISENIDMTYLYYYISSDFFNQELIEASTGTSNSHQRIKKQMLLNKNIWVPDINTQCKIAKILLDIDNKIELNNQINDNLYEIAISYLKDRVSDENVSISRFGKIQCGYAFKSKDLKDDRTINRIIKIKNLRSEINADINNSQFVDDEVILNLDKKFELHKGDVVIAMTGAELGKTGFIYGKDRYYLNQRVGVVKGNTKETELYLRVFMLSKDFQTLLNSKGYGSAQPNISTTDIENIMINNITEKKLTMLYKTINPIYQKIINNCEENISLEQLGDTLLPKLMNGEINLDKIEI